MESHRKNKRIRSVLTAVLFLAIFAGACRKHQQIFEPVDIWREYGEYGHTPRKIEPRSHVEHLRTTMFRDGQLDNLPAFGIILYDAHVDDYLDRIGYGPSEIRRIDIGEATASILYVVQPSRGDAPFVIAPGLPGAGGITTQAAELGALGVRYLVHIGTCGILGTGIKNDTLIVSAGSYKDGAAALLSGSAGEGRNPLAFPDRALSTALVREIRSRGIPVAQCIGITVPIFYFQPSGLIKRLLRAEDLPSEYRPSYVEMEEAPFFMTAEIMKMKSASVVAGTDRYLLQHGGVVHEFMDVEAGRRKTQAVEATLAVFQKLREKHARY
jgi:uridine phosphorylase